MTVPAKGRAVGAAAMQRPGISGWVEAGWFAVALSVLNVSYGLGHQIGAHPVAFLVYAMNTASVTLLLISGVGPHWRGIIRHPLSYAIGGGIIAMEAVYYMLLKVATPADGSLLVRLNVPTAALLAFLLLGRRTTPIGLLGHAIAVGGIASYLPFMDPGSRWIALALGLGCAVIMCLRSFATEFHPWNRPAATIQEKIQLTGLVLLVTSLAGSAAIAAAMLAAARGLILAPSWLPRGADFTHLPTIGLGLFIGALVLTVMQFLGFSVVRKIRAENFVATTALIPLVTVVFQIIAVALGILAPVPFEWRVLPPMLVMAGGVLVVIWAGRKGTY